MQVAIAGVEDVADHQVVLAPRLLDVLQHFGQARARDHAVLHVKSRTDAPERPEGVLAPLPQQVALLLRSRPAHFAGAVLPADGFDFVRLLVHGLAQPLHLNQEHRRRVHRVAGVGGFFDRAQREPVHHLERGGRDAARGDGGDRARRVAHSGVNRQHGLGSLGPAREAHGSLGHDPHRAFRTHQQPRDVVTGPIGELGPGVDHRSVREHHLEPEHVIGGHAVGQRVRPAGVFRHVAADGASLLARRVGDKIVAVVGDGERQVQVHDAGLDSRAFVLDVDFNNLLHARERHDDAALGHHRPATQACARPAGDHRHVLLRREAYNPDQVFGARREHHGVWRAQGRQRVVLVKH